LAVSFTVEEKRAFYSEASGMNIVRAGSESDELIPVVEDEC
jgi:hypothetical protein